MFGCRFSELVAADGRLLKTDPEVIFAEPVGSCADLSATVLSPIRSSFGDRFRLAPFTVLVDPALFNPMAPLDTDSSSLPGGVKNTHWVNVPPVVRNCVQPLFDHFRSGERIQPETLSRSPMSGLQAIRR